MRRKRNGERGLAQLKNVFLQNYQRFEQNKLHRLQGIHLGQWSTFVRYTVLLINKEYMSRGHLSAQSPPITLSTPPSPLMYVCMYVCSLVYLLDQSSIMQGKYWLEEPTMPKEMMQNPVGLFLRLLVFWEEVRVAFYQVKSCDLSDYGCCIASREEERTSLLLSSGIVVCSEGRKSKKQHWKINTHHFSFLSSFYSLQISTNFVGSIHVCGYCMTRQSRRKIRVIAKHLTVTLTTQFKQEMFQ